MFPLTPILAADDPLEALLKLLVPAAFVLIWIIGALTSASKKRQPQQRRENTGLEEILRDLAGANRPAEPPPLPPPPTQQQPQRRPSKPQRIKKRIKSAPPPPAPVAAEPAPAPPATFAPGDIAATELGSGRDAYGAAAKSDVVTGVGLRSWLRPSTLHRQFILTEILQPPLALRDDPRTR